MIDRAHNLARMGGQLVHLPKAGLVPPRRLDRRGMFALLAGAGLAAIVWPEDAAAKKSKKRQRQLDRRQRRQRRQRKNRQRNSGGNSNAQKIVSEAKKHVGDRYVAGGTAPGGFDCSGFTYYVVRRALGRDISPDLQAQTGVGRHVGKGSRRKGDLIFFSLEGGNRVTHVAIVLNKNRVVHAMNPQDGVKISDITSSYYQSGIHSVRRL